MSDKTKIIYLGGGGGDRSFDMLANLLLIGGLGVAGYYAYKYFIEDAAASDECTEGETDCINNYEYECVDGKLEATGKSCTPTVACVEGATKCTSDGIEYTCQDGQWLESGTCEVPTTINSIAYFFWYDGTTKPVVGMLTKLTSRETGTQWTAVTDSGGVAKFSDVPIGTYTLAVTLDRFHIDTYAAHTPFADWRYVDLSNMSIYIGKDWTNPNPIYMLKNVPSAVYTKCIWLTNALVNGPETYVTGLTGNCKCTSMIGCNHPWTHILVDIRNAWNEKIDSLVGVYNQLAQNVCFTATDLDCADKPQAFGDLYGESDDAQFVAYVWANNNNDFRQWITPVVLWDDPVDGSQQAFKFDMFFNFTACLLSYYGCYENNQDLDNTMCGN